MEEPFLLTATAPSLRTTATFIEMRQLLVDEFCIHPTVVYNSSFEKNEAGDFNDGGGMRASCSSSITVHKSHYEAGYGAIIVASSSSSITVNYSSRTFYKNKAGVDGGALYAYLGSSSITVYSSVFDNNKASDDGGVLYVLYGGSITVYNSSFTEIRQAMMEEL